AIEGSTLVVLPTGMGKTVIALLVIAERLLRKDGKVLFLAPTKPLVEQHATFLREYLLSGPVVMFTGETSPEKRGEAWKDAKIIASTPQVISNDIISGKIDLKEVTMIVFDEAHRATGNYAYVFIAEKYKETGGLVLGMTASPGSNADEILEICNTLGIERVEIRSEYDDDVRPYVQDVSIKWIKVDMPEKVRLISQVLRRALASQLRVLQSYGLIRKTDRVSTKEILEVQARIRSKLASEGKPSQALFHAASVQACAMAINHALELAETQGISALQAYFERMKVKATSKGASRASKMVLNDPDFLEAIALTNEVDYDHPKIARVADLISEQFSIKKDSRAIVFTHYRDTSERVTDALSKIDGIKPVKFVGQASKGDDKGLKQKEQIEIIQKFRNGEYNVLVATSVGEEGLDIPQTDLVIFYEPVPSEIRTIQRRGRTGRKMPGKVVILITRGTRDEAYYWSSRNKEFTMKRELEKLREELSLASPSQSIGLITKILRMEKNRANYHLQILQTMQIFRTPKMKIK
ncbi:MAG: helicase-related protein, partial [Thermoplasmata archaeon]